MFSTLKSCYRAAKWTNLLESGEICAPRIDIARRKGDSEYTLLQACGYSKESRESSPVLKQRAVIAIALDSWENNCKRIIEAVLSAYSREALEALGERPREEVEELWRVGFGEKYTCVYAGWNDPDRLKFMPWKMANQTGVSVAELQEEIAITRSETGILLESENTELYELIERQLEMSHVVSTRKLKDALAYLESQGVEVKWHLQ